jgi:flagellar hook-basal body complex protein FliE
MKDVTLVSQLKALATPTPLHKAPAAPGFADMLKSAVADTSRLQVEADRAAVALQTGEAKNIHEVTIAMEKAEVSLRLMVSMRNKAMEAYQEIMRMQV